MWRIVPFLASGVDDEEQAVVAVEGPGHHQVVDDAALVVEKLAVALLAGDEAEDVRRYQCLKRAGDAGMVRADEGELAHVRHIEQPGRFAGMLMLGNDALGILHRHVVAGKGHHAGAERHVSAVQRRMPERGRARG